MKTIIILLGSYLPNYSAVGRCMGNLAEELIRRGNRVVVISQLNSDVDRDEEWVNDQRIIRVSSRYRRLLIKSGKKTGILGCIGKLFLRSANYGLVCLNKKSIKKSEVRAYTDALSKLDCVPDVLIPTCLPFESVCAALEYKRTRPSCQVFPVLYDLFALNGRLQRNTFLMRLKKRTNQKLEADMLKESDKVFGLPTWKSYIDTSLSTYKDNFVEIEHPLLTKADDWGKMCRPADGKSWFVYTGSVDLTIRNPQYAIEMLLAFSIDHRVEIHFFSMGSAQHVVEKAAEKHTCFVSHGAVTTDVARKALNSADFLVSIGNINTLQTPSKVFEFFCTGLPIIHFAFTRTDPVIELLEKYPLSHVVIIGSDISQEVKRLEEFVNNNMNKRCEYNEIEQIYKEASPSYVVDQIALC